MQVRTNKLAVGYQGRVLIKGIDLTVEKGRIVTLIGPNGSGKSTILKTITRQLSKIAGVVCLENKDIEHIRGRELAMRMSVMLTERVKPEMMTCFEVAAMGRYPYTNAFGRLTPKDREVVEETLVLVRAEQLAGRLFSQISDGQRQRVLLARALCQEPDVMVLDEPTSFLDVRHKIELLDILRQLASQKQVAVLLSLHEIDLAAKISDWMICVKGEEIELQGPPDTVFTDQQVAALYALSSGSYNTLFGSVELSAPLGPPQFFILAGQGRGIPLYRLLQKNKQVFASGILFDNDIDYQVARVLSQQVVTAPAFEALTENQVRLAKAWIDQAPFFVDAGTPIRSQNARHQELIHYAQAAGKRMLTAEGLRAHLDETGGPL